MPTQLDQDDLHRGSNQDHNQQSPDGRIRRLGHRHTPPLSRSSSVNANFVSRDYFAAARSGQTSGFGQLTCPISTPNPSAPCPMDSESIRYRIGSPFVYCVYILYTL